MCDRNATLIARAIGSRTRLSRAELVLVLRPLFVSDSPTLRRRIAIDHEQTEFDAIALRDLLTNAVNGTASDSFSRSLRQVLVAVISNLHWRFPSAHRSGSRPTVLTEEVPKQRLSALHDEVRVVPRIDHLEPPPIRMKAVAGRDYLPDFYDHLGCHVNSPFQLHP
jgi:hypothetical protein